MIIGLQKQKDYNPVWAVWSDVFLKLQKRYSQTIKVPALNMRSLQWRDSALPHTLVELRGWLGT